MEPTFTRREHANHNDFLLQNNSIKLLHKLTTKNVDTAASLAIDDDANDLLGRLDVRALVERAFLS